MKQSSCQGNFDSELLQRGAGGVLARGSSSEPRILNRETKTHTEGSAQRAERVTQSQEGLMQAPRRAAQKSKFAEEANASKQEGLENASKGRSILS